MINEFSAHAKPSNNKAKLAFLILLLIASLGMTAYLVMSVLKIQKAGLVGALSVVFIIAAVVIYTKYVSPNFYYDITFDSEKTALFVVRQKIGKRETTLLAVALHEISDIKKETKEERKGHKTPYGTKRYVYFPTLLPDETYRIYTRSRYEVSEILIEASDEFSQMLRGYVAEAKAIEKEREENEKW